MDVLFNKHSRWVLRSRKFGKYLEGGRQDNEWLLAVNFFMGINPFCYKELGGQSKSQDKQVSGSRRGERIWIPSRGTIATVNPFLWSVFSEKWHLFCKCEGILPWWLRLWWEGSRVWRDDSEKPGQKVGREPVGECVALPSEVPPPGSSPLPPCCAFCLEC